ncbi:SE1832 family protein [Terribacillus saccharophilus]|uniref:SE1832 family protein n=1 Tax=Terribacillus saccharophilus TaxID=361277 RepID=UPI003982C74F
MNKQELENRLAELKMSYTSVQADADKLASSGAGAAHMEKQLEQMENEIKSLRQKLRALD